MSKKLRPVIKLQGRLSKETISLIVCVISATIFLGFPERAISFVSGITRYYIHEFGLAFIVIPSLLVLLSFAIAFSPFGKVRLGGAEARPEFSFMSWTAMLFAAGMGSGLVFWGVAEPVTHFSHMPAFAEGSSSPQDTALALTYFNWGIHAWSIYAISGLVMAWFAFNKGREMTISATFTAKTHFNKFQFFDFLAIVAVIFGVSGTLANTIALVQTGLQHSVSSAIGGIDFRLALLAVIAVVFTLSSTTGLKRGIKVMSLFNLWVVILLLIAVISLVNPLSVMKTAASSTLRYLEMLPSLSFSIDDNSRAWSEGWSVTYFVWWIAWAPFVGPFIARISRGRTVRQFLLCTILIPTVTTVIWFSSFGGSVFQLPLLDQVISAVNNDFTRGLFVFFDGLPRGQLFSIVTILLLILFVITSADSAIYVISMLTGGHRVRSKVVWSCTLVAITAALVLKNNILLNNQIAIFGALPFTLILVVQALVLIKELVLYRRQPPHENRID